jgi:SAM-dependent methyltransferase
LDTVEKLIGTLIVEENPVILDLMAGWNSHIPKNIKSDRVIGLGLNENELKENKSLSEYMLHDLNKDPHLPFPDNSFDIILNTVSVDYITKPFEVFDETGRILKPGGLFLVTFSNRMFPQKAIKIWRDSSEDERVLLVEDLFKLAGVFKDPRVFISTNKPRPKDDKYYPVNKISDPIYAVYGEKKGGKDIERPVFNMYYGERLSDEELKRRKSEIKYTLKCPHCGAKLKKWLVPDNPFSCTWDNEFMYICFNDACPYYVRGWDHMNRQGTGGQSYRLMYNPEKDCASSIPVPSPKALRNGIVEDTDE